MLKHTFAIIIFLVIAGLTISLSGCGTPEDYVVDTVTVSP